MHQSKQAGNSGPVKIPLSTIRRDGGTKVRAGLDQEAVSDYANAYERGCTLPPLVVFHDGTDSWLADGFHRIEAALRAGLDDIQADVRQGTLRDAILYACGADQAHGLRRSNADNRLAVGSMLEDPEWSKWSDGRIAEHCGVSDRLVNKMRAELTPNGSESTGRDGRTINTSKIGKRSPGELIRSVASQRSTRDSLIEILEPFLVPDDQLTAAGKIPMPPLEPGRCYLWLATDSGSGDSQAVNELEIYSASQGHWMFTLRYEDSPGEVPNGSEKSLSFLWPIPNNVEGVESHRFWETLTRDLLPEGQWYEVPDTVLVNTEEWLQCVPTFSARA